MTGKTKLTLAVLLVAVLAATLPSGVQAEQGGAKSVTLTLDRAVMPAALFHAAWRATKPATVTVYDFVIRDFSGAPIDGFAVQKSSGRVEIPIETVKEIRQTGWISKHTEDIPRISYVVPVVITLTDGREVKTLMNADFGTVEGITEHGWFFLNDPQTVTSLVFNRD